MVNERIFNFLERGLDNVLKASHTFSYGGQKLKHKPFFAAMNLRDYEMYILNAINGALTSRSLSPDHSTSGRVEVRMGDYDSGGMGRFTFDLPRDLSEEASMHKIWFSSNEAFWDCVDDQAARVYTAIGCKNTRDKFRMFSKEAPNISIAPEKLIEIDLEKYDKIIKEASKEIWDGGKDILNAVVSIVAQKEGKYFINSEGSKVFYDNLRYATITTLAKVDKNGLVIPHSHAEYTDDPKDLPTYEKMIETGRRMKEELCDILSSPQQKNGNFPAILDPENHGVLWHEVVGHALEANNMQEDDEENPKCSLFAGKIGKKVAPSFITIEDDPTIQTMDGYFPFDDEGVRARKTTLIDKGILREYLHCRESAGFFRKKSNGHARAQGANDPIARMSNLIVKSSNELPFDQLKENLMRICHEKKTKYGLIFEGASGGLTLPAQSYFSTYPSKMYRLYTDGKMEQVRGAYLVGTPYQIVNNIVQTSNERGIFRGVCGAESGWIPSAQEAPHVLVSNLEVNCLPSGSFSSVKKFVVKKKN